jgi:hypothetical protein
MAAGHVPGQGSAPVVPGQVELFRSGRVGQGEHVRRQLGVPVRGPGGWPGLWGVAAQVGRQHPVTAPGERGRHPVPAAAVLRKPVQEDGDAVRPVPAGRGGVGDLQAERRAGKALHAGILPRGRAVRRLDLDAAAPHGAVPGAFDGDERAPRLLRRAGPPGAQAARASVSSGAGVASSNARSSFFACVTSRSP